MTDTVDAPEVDDTDHIEQLTDLGSAISPPPDQSGPRGWLQ